MRLSSYNPQERYRRRAADQLAGLLTVLVLVCLSFGIGFWLGGKNSSYQHGVLKDDVEQLSSENTVLQDTITELRAEAQTAIARHDRLKRLYDDAVPEGPMRDLVKLLKRQIDEGRDAKRLAFLIRSARPPSNCSDEQALRFIVSTPAYKGPESRVVLANGALVITGSGLSAVNTEGRAEAWFDPSKAVSVEFVVSGGEAEVKTGVLPMRHSVVIGDREYRINIAEGEL